MRFWFLEHVQEVACPSCGRIAPRLSHLVTLAGTPIESEIEPAFALAWGQILRRSCQCSASIEYVYPQGMRAYAGERDALAQSEPLTLIPNALAPGEHGEHVLVRLYHIGQGTEYIKYWNPTDAICAVCGDAASIVYSPDRGEVLRLMKRNEKPVEFLVCDSCDAAVQRRDVEHLAERLDLPRGPKMLPRFETMSALEQGRSSATYMRTLAREVIEWQPHDLRVNDAGMLERGSLGVSGEVNGVSADSHGWILDHPRVYITGYQLFRAAFRSRYSYSIPSREALERIEATGRGGIVECGAGNGYWAYLLQARGHVAIDPFDIAPVGAAANTWYAGEAQPWTAVRRGDVDVLRKHKAKTLLLCWPPAQSSMALYALQLFKGDTIVYIGAHDDSCATPVFFEGLRAQWREAERIAIPTIWRLADDVRIYRR